MSDEALAERGGRRDLSEIIAGELLAKIRADGLKPGDPLPSIAALSERHGVAASTMREVLRQLQATGAVTIRHGSGVFVGSRVNAVMLPNPYRVPLSTEVLRELLEARLVLEPELASRAASARRDEHLASLRADLDRARVLIEGDEPAKEVLTRVNMVFHWHIAVATGNSVLADLMQSLVTAHEADQREILRMHADEATDLDDHEAILAAIAEGDPAKARNLMQHHLESVLGTVSGAPQPSALPDEGGRQEGHKP